MLESLLTQLIETLNAEWHLHQELLILLEDEARKMGTLSGSELLHLHSKKMRVCRKVKGLEDQRLPLTHEIADFLSVPSSSVSLQFLIEQAPVFFKEPLEHCQQQLRAVIRQIQECASRNSRISEARLKSIEVSLKFLTDFQKNQQVYSGSGALQKSNASLERTLI